MFDNDFLKYIKILTFFNQSFCNFFFQIRRIDIVSFVKLHVWLDHLYSNIRELLYWFKNGCPLFRLAQ